MKRLSWWVFGGLVALYVITRGYIWVARPTAFTDIIYAFMPYAHLWAAGETPYLKQWFEYPPATIPIIYLPHMVDMGTLHYSWHIDYLTAFRLELLFIDVVLFAIIWKVLATLKVKPGVFVGGLVYYCLITAKAHHFIYEEPELYFVTAVSGAVLLPLISSKAAARPLRWISFFLGTALKYINAPLGFVYFGFEAVKKKLNLFVIGLAFILVWGFPLAYFRSSLAVSLVYQKIRGIQIESVPATLVRTVDAFTHTEHPVE